MSGRRGLISTRPVIAISMDTATGHWPERRAQRHCERNRANGNLKRRQVCVISSGILAAGPAFFVSAWVLMLFAGVVDIDVGIRPFGYITSMIVTIALWLTVAPVIGSISRMGRRKG